MKRVTAQFAVVLYLLLFVHSLAAQELNVWFGTTRNNTGQSSGIWHATFNTDKGALSKANLALDIDSPGWITWHPTLPIIYSIAKLEKNAVVYSINVADDQTLSIAQTIVVPNGLCFLKADQTGSVLIGASYGGGSVVSIPIGEDGMLVDAVQKHKHQGGSNVVEGRQESPHPHSVQFSPDNKFVFVPDLGLDQLVVYRFEAQGKKLTPTETPIDCVKGGGPRHMKILEGVGEQNRNFAFVLNELELSLSCFEVFDDGMMKLLQTEATISEQQKSENVFNSASEIRVHANGKFIYTANRGHDSISLFHFDRTNFKLTLKQVAPIHGAWPRNFNLTPDGKWLLAAAARTNSVSVFAVDQETGMLTVKRKPVFVPGAICVSIR